MISSLGHEVMTTPDHHSDTNAEPLVLGTFMKNTLLAFGPSKVESECAFSRCKTGILITLCYLNLFQHFLPPPPPSKKRNLEVLQRTSNPFVSTLILLATKN